MKGTDPQDTSEADWFCSTNKTGKRRGEWMELSGTLSLGDLVE